MLIVFIHLDCGLAVKIEVLAGYVDEELLTLRDEGFENLLKIVVDGFDSIFTVHPKTIAQGRNFLDHLFTGFLCGLLES